MKPSTILRLRAIAQQLRDTASEEEHTGDLDAAETLTDMAAHSEAVADVAHQMNQRTQGGRESFPVPDSTTL